MTTNYAPPEQPLPHDEAAHRAAEFRLFAATWHPLDRIPFPALPPQLATESAQTEPTPNRITGYF